MPVKERKGTAKALIQEFADSGEEGWEVDFSKTTLDKHLNELYPNRRSRPIHCMSAHGKTFLINTKLVLGRRS
jgi:hypothetical protein